MDRVEEISTTNWSALMTPKEMSMKRYVKPSLKGLGLLRVVTQFSTCTIEIDDHTFTYPCGLLP